MLSQTLLSVLASLLATTTAVPANPFQQRDLTFNYGSKMVRGVNLGGWFVLEPWITPSLFAAVNDDSVVDEWTLTAKLGKSAQSTMQKHWDEWITEADFKAIAKAGLNHVRIPVGYWAVSPEKGDPYVQGQLKVLDKAVGWARSAGLKMLIDLHGVVGSQNGFDNSGRLGAINWQKSDKGAKKTIKTIKALSERYAKFTDVVTAIQPVNEPMGSNNALDMGQVKKYYYDAWGTVRDSNNDTAVVIHDAFQDMDNYWNGFMNAGSGVWNVILDTHQYQIFSDDQVAMSPSAHITAACKLGKKIRSTDKWTIVGEWTGGITDCAQWLNGKGKGARYDGTFPGSTKHGSCNGKYKGSVKALSAADKKNIRSFIEAQLDAYEQHTGWIFWTWKAESAPEWNMKALLADGLFPQPLCHRKHPNQCSFTSPACS